MKLSTSYQIATHEQAAGGGVRTRRLGRINTHGTSSHGEGESRNNRSWAYLLNNSKRGRCFGHHDMRTKVYKGTEGSSVWWMKDEWLEEEEWAKGIIIRA